MQKALVWPSLQCTMIQAWQEEKGKMEEEEEEEDNTAARVCSVLARHDAIACCALPWGSHEYCQVLLRVALDALCC